MIPTVQGHGEAMGDKLLAWLFFGTQRVSGIPDETPGSGSWRPAVLRYRHVKRRVVTN